ncbi:hypothetical protein [Halomonas getboli]|uniref:hypothetical protein n=1 Tax=Halomonas getboli TaxID=2935862 RepID=UPI001FFEFD97|nr:hypothetical protein [Halomonas getboli]MCK2182962.1 hypothetical protein [Halomonas getboli]
MRTSAWTSRSHRAWQRLLALLLVIAFALASLPGHAAGNACQADCAQMSMASMGLDDLPDPGDACGAGCAAPVASLSPAVMAPRALAADVVTHLSDHVPQPPRRPPRA